MNCKNTICSNIYKNLHRIIQDELHLIKIRLDEVNFSVKLEGQKENKFISNIGSPTRDGASALL